jgi:hypothetical protein
MVDEKVHPVEEIDFADARIRSQEQQVDVRILLLQAFLHAFGDDVVGDATKRWRQSTFVTLLRANDAISPAIRQPPRVVGKGIVLDVNFTYYTNSWMRADPRFDGVELPNGFSSHSSIAARPYFSHGQWWNGAYPRARR